MEKHVKINDEPARHVYLIQLDHNVQFESQAIPLHILENKHGQPLQLFLEPQIAVTDNIYQTQEYHNEHDSKIQIGPQVTNTLNVTKPVQTQDNIINNPESYKPPIKNTLNVIKPVQTQDYIINNSELYKPAVTNTLNVIKPVQTQDYIINNSELYKPAVTNTLNVIKPVQTQDYIINNSELYKPAVTNTLNVIKPVQTQDYIINNPELYRPLKLDGSLPLVPICIKKEPTSEIVVEVQRLTNKDESKLSTRVKIKNYVHISDTRVPSRAFAVLPSVLHFRGKQILPRRTISANVRFGPVQGIRKIITKKDAAALLKSSDPNSPVFLLSHDEEHVIHIDVTDKDKSNWLGLLPLGQQSFMATSATGNVWIYEENNELYGLTAQPILPRVPLKIGYSKKYCEDHNIARHGLDLETVNSIQWWCNECNRALPSASLLKRHTDVYHKITMNSYQKNYRCKYCKRPFGSRFSVKRHMFSHCTKRPKKTTEEKDAKPIETTQTNAEPDINTVLEDNRIPSDESFQNFTNSLDFSTNLFDTDRMASLDLSGHSRAETDLNPYSINFRDDNDLCFTNGSEPMQNDETNQDNNTPMLETCSYCDQVLAKESKNKHLRQCPSRLICECGRVFRHKKSLAIHVHKAHPNSQPKEKTDEENSKRDDKSETAYKCHECPLGFKRRGMLVNHLWRIHKLISTMPVEKKVKHYPCVACPRIYCSASKRDIHIRVHHPGAEMKNRRYIEGGVKSCQPASCSECPRQYTTRAKLLQHIRAQHPLLAKSMYREQLEQKAKTKLVKSNKTREEKNKSNSTY